MRLMALYARPVLIISGTGSTLALLLMMSVSISSLTDTMMTATILKILITAISALLFRMLASKDREYFYINVGVHPKLLLKWAISLDAAAYIVLSILIIVIRHGIAG